MPSHRYVLVMRYGQLVGIIKKKDILRYIASEVHGLHQQ
jgi:predicted transcriptional regulator